MSMTISNALRVAIGVPSNGQWRDTFGWSLSNLLIHTAQAAPHIALTFLPMSSSSIVHNRFMIARKALEICSTHVLWLDSDMVFPPSALMQLLAHDLDVVGAIYRARHHPHMINAWGEQRHPNGVMIRGRFQFAPSDRGLVEVDWMGLGLCLVRASVFPRIAQPWFQFQADETHCLGEDENFFLRVREAGIGCYADLDLSREVGHIGATTVRLHNADPVNERTKPCPSASPLATTRASEQEQQA